MCNWHRVDSDTAKEAFSQKYQQERRAKRRRALVVPPPREPIAIEREYTRELWRVVAAIQRAVRKIVEPAIPSLMDDAGTRADDLASRTAALAIAVRAEVAGSVSAAATVAASIGDKTKEFATKDRIRMIRRAVGIEPTFFDDNVSNVLRDWKSANEAFITEFSEEAIDKAMDTVGRGVRAGTPTRDIAKKLMEQSGISRRRAMTIARTEVAQLNSVVVRQRDRELGITRYRWRTSKDQRVRSEHAEREGQIFEWSEPPADGHPGQPINCRCTAEPVLEDLLDGL